MMNEKTLTTSVVYIDDTNGAMKQLEPMKDIPVVVDDNYIGNFNSLTCSLEVTADVSNMFKDLLKEKTNELYIQDSYGHKYKGNIHKEITNIHRTRKGKRYIIKFDHTELLHFIGKKVGD